MKTLTDRFWPKVLKANGCWVWIGFKDYRNYGMIWHEKHKCRAHRISWILAHGRIPTRMHVLHRCDNPSCVRPDHLFLGNHTENMKDMVTKGRSSKGCSRSMHKLTEGIVEVIRKVYALHHPDFGQRPLARYFGVSGPTIESAVCERTWKHVK